MKRALVLFAIAGCHRLPADGLDGGSSAPPSAPSAPLATTAAAGAAAAEAALDLASLRASSEPCPIAMTAPPAYQAGKGLGDR